MFSLVTCSRFQSNEDDYQIEEYFVNKKNKPTSLSKGIIGTGATIATLGSAIAFDPGSKDGKVFSVYLTNYTTATLKPMIGEAPVFPRVVLYPLVMGSAFALQATGDVGKQVFPFLSGAAVKFASNDVGKYLKRANKADGDSDDSEDDDEDTSAPWLCSNEGDYGYIEEKIERVLQPGVALVQNENGKPHLCTRVGITGCSVLSALASNVFVPGSFASYCMMGLLRKVLKPVISPTPLIPRYVVHAVALGSAAFCDFGGLITIPRKIFPAVCDFSFGLLIFDVKKGGKGAFRENAWCYNGENGEVVEELERSDEEKEDSRGCWKKGAMSASSLTATLLAYTYLPNSLTPILATDLFCATIKPVIKTTPQAVRYTLLTGVMAGGYTLQGYTGVPCGTIGASLAVKSILSDIRMWTRGKGKKIAPLLPTSWNPATWFCPPKKDKSKDKELPLAELESYEQLPINELELSEEYVEIDFDEEQELLLEDEPKSDERQSSWWNPMACLRFEPDVI
jgi:hypothetical protein